MKIRQTPKSIIVSVLLVIVLIVLDQLTKMLAVNGLSEDIIIIRNVLQLHYLMNTGAAFSILRGQMIVFYITTPILCLLIIYFYLMIPSDNKRYLWLDAVAVLLFAGALGNYIDRIRLHYVVDFIYFSLIDFPVFNVADIYVTVGAFMLVLFVLFYYKDDELKIFFPKKENSNEASDE